MDAVLSFHLCPFYLHCRCEVSSYSWHFIKISQHVRLFEFQPSGKQRQLMPLEQETSLQVGFYMDWSKACHWRNAAKSVPVVVGLSSARLGVRLPQRIGSGCISRCRSRASLFLITAIDVTPIIGLIPPSLVKHCNFSPSKGTGSCCCTLG